MVSLARKWKPGHAPWSSLSIPGSVFNVKEELCDFLSGSKPICWLYLGACVCMTLCCNPFASVSSAPTPSTKWCSDSVNQHACIYTYGRNWQNWEARRPESALLFQAYRVRAKVHRESKDPLLQLVQKALLLVPVPLKGSVK